MIGVSNDTQAIRDCFNHMLSNGSKFYDYSGNTYKHVGDIVFVGSNKHIELEGNISFSSTDGAISFTGSLTTIGNISVAATANSKQITSTGNLTGLKAEDVIIIHNQIDYSFSEYRSYYRDGEIKRVANVSGSTISFSDELENSYTGTTTDKVFKLEPIQLVIKGNIKFKSDSSYALKVIYCADSLFENIEVLSLSGNVRYFLWFPFREIL